MPAHAQSVPRGSSTRTGHLQIDIPVRTRLAALLCSRVTNLSLQIDDRPGSGAGASVLEGIEGCRQDARQPP